MGPRGAGSGRVGPSRAGYSRAEWGWGGVGHALGFNYITLRLGPGYKGPSRAVRAEWGWGGVGHTLGFNYITTRLGMHWDSIKLL